MNNSVLYEALNKFEPITLSQMDGVKLLDRIDTKFMFHDKDLPKILNEISAHYLNLDVNGIRLNNYETLYFDTGDFELYRKHHNGKNNRFKFRYRKYVESNLHFFEVKFKSSKGRTVKDRIKRDEIVHEISGKSGELVTETSGVDPAGLLPKLWVNYSRMTFVNKHSQERLTIDTNLAFKDTKQEKKIDHLVIAEVKQSKAGDSSPFISVMKKFHVRNRSISKYCLGVITMNPEIKKNNFKPTLLLINKILQPHEPII